MAHYKHLNERERERERETDRQTDRQTDRDTETERLRQRQTDRDRETEKDLNYSYFRFALISGKAQINIYYCLLSFKKIHATESYKLRVAKLCHPICVVLVNSALFNLSFICLELCYLINSTRQAGIKKKRKKKKEKEKEKKRKKGKRKNEKGTSTAKDSCIDYMQSPILHSRATAMF